MGLLAGVFIVLLIPGALLLVHRALVEVVLVVVAHVVVSVVEVVVDLVLIHVEIASVLIVVPKVILNLGVGKSMADLIMSIRLWMSHPHSLPCCPLARMLLLLLRMRHSLLKLVSLLPLSSLSALVYLHPLLLPWLVQVILHVWLSPLSLGS